MRVITKLKVPPLTSVVAIKAIADSAPIILRNNTRDVAGYPAIESGRSHSSQSSRVIKIKRVDLF